MKNIMIWCLHKWLWSVVLVFVGLFFFNQLEAQQETPFNGERSFANGLSWMRNNT